MSELDWTRLAVVAAGAAAVVFTFWLASTWRAWVKARRVKKALHEHRYGHSDW